MAYAEIHERLNTVTIKNTRKSLKASQGVPLAEVVQSVLKFFTPNLR